MATFVPYALVFLFALNAGPVSVEGGRHLLYRFVSRGGEFKKVWKNYLATALKCYKCNSKDSVSCAWGLTSFTYDTEECASAGILSGVIGPKCYKITAENKDGGEYIARGCLTAGSIGCSAIASSIGWIASQSSNDPDSLRNLNCDTCDYDKCNSAQRLTGVTFIGLILAAALFVF